MQKPSVYVIYLLYITHIYIAITGGGRFYPSRATIFPKTISFMKRHCSKSFSFPFPSVYLVRSAWWKPSSHYLDIYTFDIHISPLLHYWLFQFSDNNPLQHSSLNSSLNNVSHHDHFCTLTFRRHCARNSSRDSAN